MHARARRRRIGTMALLLLATMLAAAYSWKAWFPLADLRPYVPLCAVLTFAYFFVESARHASRLLEDWKNGWLATVPAFERGARVALWSRLLIRCGVRVTIASMFLLAALPAASVETAGLASMSLAITTAMVAGLAGRWFAPQPQKGGHKILRVTQLTARRPGTVPVWQATVALTAWRTPKAAVWCMVILLGIPNGMPLAITVPALLCAFIFGGAVAAAALSWEVLPRAFGLMRVARRGAVLRQGLRVPVGAVLIGSMVLGALSATIGIPVAAAMVALVCVSAWASIRPLRELWTAP